MRREGISRLTGAGAFLAHFIRKEKPFESFKKAKQLAFSRRDILKNPKAEALDFLIVCLLYQVRTYFQNQ